MQFSAHARIIIISQAPGRLVHETGVLWNDVSGARLREWTGLAPEVFYDPEQVALIPMGFCYPGRGIGADLPPRPECARLWHPRVMAQVSRRRLTLLVGQYAQSHYLPQTRSWTVTARVKVFEGLTPGVLPLPHPSWRSTGWMQRNPWFAEAFVPRLRERVAEVLAQR